MESCRLASCKLWTHVESCSGVGAADVKCELAQPVEMPCLCCLKIQMLLVDEYDYACCAATQAEHTTFWPAPVS